jgi:murein DD-endopeptidase MepM/ murein hydrolase activator NlpD
MVNINIKNISNQFSSVNNNLNTSLRSSKNINNTLLKQSRNRRNQVSSIKSIYNLRRENVRRKEQKSLLEASSVGAAIRRQSSVIADSSKGFLQRVLEFTGTLLAGWLIYNLPTIMAMGREFMARASAMTRIMKNFVGNTINIFSGFAKVLGATFNNIARLDFLDSNGKVRMAMDELYGSVQKLDDDLDEAIKLLTTSLGVGLESGEDAPPTGTDYTTPPGGQPSGGGGSGSGGSNKWKPLLDSIGAGEGGYTSMYPGENYPQITGMTIEEVIQFQKQKLKDGRASAAVGKYQMLYPENYAKAAGLPLTAKFSPENQDKMAGAYIEKNKGGNDWLSGKITDEQFGYQLAREFAGLKQPNGVGFYDGDGRNKATVDWKVTKASLKKIKSTPQSQSPTQQPQAPQLNQNSKFYKGQDLTKLIGGVKSPSIVVTSLKGMRDDKYHSGIDIATDPGTYISLRVDCEVVGYLFESGGYGHVIDVWIPQYKVQLRFAHLYERPKYTSKGTKIPANTSFARVGSSGRSTGPHIHLDADSRYDSRGNGNLDPSPYVSLLLLTRNPSTGASQPTSLAQQSNTSNTANQQQLPSANLQTQQPSTPSITPERKGQDIVFIDNVVSSPQMPPMMMGSSKPSVIFVGSNVNSIIKKQLLLDLSYT